MVLPSVGVRKRRAQSLALFLLTHKLVNKCFYENKINDQIICITFLKCARSIFKMVLYNLLQSWVMVVEF